MLPVQPGVAARVPAAPASAPAPGLTDLANGRLSEGAQLCTASQHLCRYGRQVGGSTVRSALALGASTLQTSPPHRRPAQRPRTTHPEPGSAPPAGACHACPSCSMRTGAGLASPCPPEEAGAAHAETRACAERVWVGAALRCVSGYVSGQAGLAGTGGAAASGRRSGVHSKGLCWGAAGAFSTTRDE